MSTLRSTGESFEARARARTAGMDWTLLGLTLAVSFFGIYMVRAATESDVSGDPGFFFTRQLAYTLVGLVCMFFILRLDLEWLSRYVWTIYAILVASVGAVLVLGASARGSTRWIDLGPVRVQPSELGKVVIAFVIAVVVMERLKSMDPARLTLMVLALALLPVTVPARPVRATGLANGSLAGAASRVIGRSRSTIAVSFCARSAAASAAVMLTIKPSIA
jgi:cell division protein FtsW (lipid II flippase)